jgi:prepilin-type N-terminal cleavage/methylation domain-containing protein
MRLAALGSRAGRSRLSDERGFSLIELLIAMVLSLVIGGAAMTFMIVSLREQNAVSSRASATRVAEVGLEKLARDLRQAMTSVTITAPTSATTKLAFSIPTPGADSTGKAVTWTCPNTTAAATNIGTCTRTLAGTQTNSIAGVQSLSLTTSSGAALGIPTSSTPNYLGITLTVQVLSQNHTSSVLAGPDGTSTTPSTKAIVVQTGVDLRNFS